jgi:hypothetical protein
VLLCDLAVGILNQVGMACLRSAKRSRLSGGSAQPDASVRDFFGLRRDLGGFVGFVDDVEPRLLQALVALYGPVDGRGA